MEGADVQALRQFVGQSRWPVEEVQRRLALKVVDLLSEREVWIIDETAFAKAGQHSVGVAQQSCGTLGKMANGQVAMSLHWSSAEARCPLLWRLYLPKAWLEDAEQAAADVYYGNDLDFRQQLRQRQLPYVVEVEPSTVVRTEDPNLPWPPPKKTGWPRQYSPLEALPRPQNLRAVAKRLPASAWRTVAWRRGSRGVERLRFAKIQVWAAHG